MYVISVFIEILCASCCKRSFRYISITSVTSFSDIPDICVVKTRQPFITASRLFYLQCRLASHADAALDHLPRKLGLQVLSDRLEIDIKELRARALADTVRREVLMNLCFEPERGKRGNAEHQLKRVRHVARELLEPGFFIELTYNDRTRKLCVQLGDTMRSSYWRNFFLDVGESVAGIMPELLETAEAWSAP